MIEHGLIRCCLACVLLILVTGCTASTSQSGNPQSPYLAGQEPIERSPLTAERLTIEAADLMQSDPVRAEALLRDALAADLYYGPAHNNLGVLYLQRGELYEAAHEFEWARKLMPGHPDPRMNLALTLETAGRIDDALETYATALEVYPDHTPTIQAITRCQLRHARLDERTAQWLDHIALNGETETWRDWAQLQLTKHEPSSGIR
jgi:Tfp pilus assembly protein PilF